MPDGTPSIYGRPEGVSHPFSAGQHQQASGHSMFAEMFWGSLLAIITAFSFWYQERRDVRVARLITKGEAAAKPVADAHSLTADLNYALVYVCGAIQVTEPLRDC